MLTDRPDGVLADWLIDLFQTALGPRPTRPLFAFSRFLLALEPTVQHQSFVLVADQRCSMNRIPFWRRPLFVCFSVGLIAGMGVEILYQKSGYCIDGHCVEHLVLDRAIDAELRRRTG